MKKIQYDKFSEIENKTADKQATFVFGRPSPPPGITPFIVYFLFFDEFAGFILLIC